MKPFRCIAALFLLAAAFTASPGVAATQTPANALIEAVRANDLSGIRRMIAAGVNVNTPAERGNTALMYAAGFGTPEAMRLLLDARADVNAKNAFGGTALMWGISDYGKVKLLVDQGADVNALAKPGCSALLLAAMQDGSESVVKLLLAKGADWKVRDRAGTTVLTAAAAADNRPLAKLAVEKGLDVNAPGAGGMTALIWAASNGNVELAKLLLQKGANVNAVSDKSSEKVKNGVVRVGRLSALQMGSVYGPPELVKLLLDAGAKVDAKDDRNMTALGNAVTNERQDAAIVRMLLAAGADSSLELDAGSTAADWARKYAHPEVLGAFQFSSPARKSQTVAVQTLKPAEIRMAAEKSLALMQRVSSTFFETGGCSSCHAQAMASMAVQVARERGLRFDAAVAQKDLALTTAQWAPAAETLILRLDPPGGIDMLEYALFDMAAAGRKGDRVTDGMIHNLASQQGRDGGWHEGGFTRAPIQESDFTRTAMALRALQVFGPEACRADYNRRVERAKAWLESAKPRWTEDRVMQLLGLKWAGAKPEQLQRLAASLAAEQNADGGWAQNPFLESDAYATGQALYALNRAVQMTPTDAVYGRGVLYLLANQQADGSWHVKSRAPRIQPYFQSGFPYDEDQWISMAGTGWATMALGLAVEPVRVASR